MAFVGLDHQCSFCLSIIVSLVGFNCQYFRRLGAVVNALFAGRGCCCSCLWECLLVLSFLVIVAASLVSGRVCGCSRRWKRFLSLLLLGASVGALSLEAVVGDFRWERSSVLVDFCRKRSLVLSSVVNRQW